MNGLHEILLDKKARRDKINMHSMEIIKRQ